MPKLTVEGASPIDVADGTRPVLAIEQQAGVDILHACGGQARCTTCRVEFVSGEPSAMTQAEQDKLAQKGLVGVRLSCQILCTEDMTVRAHSRLEGSGRADAGGPPAPAIEPPPVWLTKA
jgi:ferredoxin